MMDRKGISVNVRTDASGKVAGALFIDRVSRCVLDSSEVRGLSLSDIRDLESKASLKEGNRAGNSEGQQTQKVSASRKM
jgi:hypothetical protein